MSKDSREKPQYFIVYDLETGGFSEIEHAITEVALIVINGDTLEEVDRYTSFIKTYGGLGYSQQALDVTGITMEMIGSGKEAGVVVKEIEALLVKYNSGRGKRPILCGHNIISFDNKFFRKLFQLLKKDLDKLINTDFYVDTMWFSRMKTPVDKDTQGTHTLSSACLREGIEVVNAHRAINDTVANTELVLSYIKNLRGEGTTSVEEKEERVRDKFRF